MLRQGRSSCWARNCKAAVCLDKVAEGFPITCGVWRHWWFLGVVICFQDIPVMESGFNNEHLFMFLIAHT